MRHLAQILAAAAFAASAPAALADSCPTSGHIRSGPPVSGGGATTLFLYNNVNAPTSLYRTDGSGNLRVDSSVGPMEMAQTNASRGFAYVVETSLDGVPVCVGGTIVFTGNGECHVSVDQDADNFYLQPQGACEIQ